MRFFSGVVFAILVLSGLSAGLAAQSPATDNADVAAPPQADVGEPEDSAERPVDSKPQETTPIDDTEQSPYDYEASEEISEDRSVSFPVDI